MPVITFTSAGGLPNSRISPKLLYRWQQAQLVAEVGSMEVARDPEVRALRAAGGRAVLASGRARSLCVPQPRSFVPRTTDLDPAVRAAPNRLRGQPAPTAPNRVWVGDITYLPRQGGGWLYLAVWLDRCSRKVVGCDVRETIPEDRVSEAFRRPPAGLVAHSDQGSQYTPTRFKDLLARHRAQQSMSRRGNYYDNAHAESFWIRFKAELLDGGSFPGLAEAKLEISHHIAYYNAERRHSAFGYLAPNHFETQLQTTSQLCSA